MRTCLVTQNISAFKGCDMVKLIFFNPSSRAVSDIELAFYFLTVKYVAVKNMTT